ncbi:hypothetical protein [Dysgonomonas macrotermitis]|uniref:hypothetical protein n=1 Tax=Dysgonomonas macrotermitis TaxID=1346286 RepID=UPI0012FC3030|nr:hypothetical protein [Dysgonomonas macrotermitis]
MFITIFVKDEFLGLVLAVFANIPLFIVLSTALLEQYRKHVEYEDSTNTDS